MSVLVPRLPVAEGESPIDGSSESSLQQKLLTQNYKIMDFKAVGFMQGRPVTGAGLDPAYLGLSRGVI